MLKMGQKCLKLARNRPKKPARAVRVTEIPTYISTFILRLKPENIRHSMAGKGNKESIPEQQTLQRKICPTNRQSSSNVLHFPSWVECGLEVMGSHSCHFSHCFGLDGVTWCSYLKSFLLVFHQNNRSLIKLPQSGRRTCHFG